MNAIILFTFSNGYGNLLIMIDVNSYNTINYIIERPTSIFGLDGLCIPTSV